MKFRLAGATYRVIAEKLTAERAQVYADANGISIDRAMKKIQHVSIKTHCGGMTVLCMSTPATKGITPWKACWLELAQKKRPRPRSRDHRSTALWVPATVTARANPS